MWQRIDMLASEPQFASHLAPVWRAIPDEHRGVFWAGSALVGRKLRESGVTVETLRHMSRRVTSARPILTASIGDYNRARRMGYLRMAYMEHGCGQSYAGDSRTAKHPSYAGGRGRERVELILAPNEIAAARWRAAYPGVAVHVVGATRLLPAPDDEQLLCVSFHWSGAIPEMRNAFGHYWRSFIRLRQQLPLIGHAHPRVAPSIGRRFRDAGIEFVGDVHEVARRATVYAVDNSSTLWELGRTRPVIALNAPWYRRDVEHGLRFWSHVPQQADDPEQLLTLARHLLKGETDDERTRRESLVADVIPYHDGAERASRLLLSWML